MAKWQKKSQFGEIRNFLGPVFRKLTGQRRRQILEGHDTGMRLNKHRHWLHLACTKTQMYYYIHRELGVGVMSGSWHSLRAGLSVITGSLTITKIVIMRCILKGDIVFLVRELVRRTCEVFEIRRLAVKSCAKYKEIALWYMYDDYFSSKSVKHITAHILFCYHSPQAKPENLDFDFLVPAMPG